MFDWTQKLTTDRGKPAKLVGFCRAGALVETANANGKPCVWLCDIETGERVGLEGAIVTAAGECK